VDFAAGADSTLGSRHAYELLLTCSIGATHFPQISFIAGSSIEAAPLAFGGAALVAPTVMRALGKPTDGPTLVGTGQLATMHVGSSTDCSPRSPRFLLRYHMLLPRAAAGGLTFRHIPSSQMAAKIVAKWLLKPKAAASLSYVCYWSHA
jgi:hypothetical protein